MDRSKAPAPNTWLRPVGRFEYLMRVTASDIEAYGAWIAYDKHDPSGVRQSTGHGVSPLVQVRPGIWRDNFNWPHGRWSCCPLYYRTVMPPAGVTAELFA